jgi:hypothetical protein
MSFYSGAGAPPVSNVAATGLMFLRTFEGSNIPTETFTQTATGMTSAQTGGFFVLNSSADTTPADFISVSSRKTFPLFGVDGLCAEMWIQTTGDTEDSYAAWGLMTAPSSPGASVDGIYFRMVAGTDLSLTADATPVLQAVFNNAGVETIANIAKGAANLPASGVPHRYRIEVRHNCVLFSIDEKPCGSIDTSGVILPAATCTQPLGFSIGNGNAVGARTMKIGLLAVYPRYITMHRPWGHAMAGNGLGGYQNPPGQATGQTASYANGAVAGAFTPANGGGGALNALGGQFQCNATGVSENDLTVFAYNNPAGSATVSGRTLYVTGIRIGELLVQGVAVVTAAVLQWGCGVASSASMAQTDSATGVSPRKIALGMQTLAATAAVGTIAPGLPWHDFSQAPVMVPPGGRFLVFYKVLNGAATGSLVYRGTVGIAGYFE